MQETQVGNTRVLHSSWKIFSILFLFYHKSTINFSTPLQHFHKKILSFLPWTTAYFHLLSNKEKIDYCNHLVSNITFVFSFLLFWMVQEELDLKLKNPNTSIKQKRSCSRMKTRKCEKISTSQPKAFVFRGVAHLCRAPFYMFYGNLYQQSKIYNH